MHTARITQIDIDAANKYLVTSSDDKTARVWDLETGSLLTVLRPPIGDGAEGRLYAAAISPDGQTVAAAGWTGHQWEQTNSIYLFDRQSGRLINRIKNLPNAIFRLMYSSDGQYLAAGLSVGHGLQLYDASINELVWRDSDYGDSIYGLDFDAAGRLVTSSLDGFVRLYEPDENGAMRLITKRKQVGGRLPYGVSFSPDGSKVAVGFSHSEKVLVLSGQDLSHLYTPDTNDLKYNAIAAVAWSADGTTLFGGGSLHANGIYMIRAWAEAGRGKTKDIPAASHVVMHIIPLRDGGVVYGAGDPLIGLVDAKFNRKLFMGRAIASYGHGQRDFLLSSDGSTVQFNYGPPNRHLGRFSITGHKLEDGAVEAEGLLPPKTEAGGFKFGYEEKTRTFKLNGKPIPLATEHLEGIISRAISPDKQYLLLGTNFNVRLFDKKGLELWKVVAPGMTEAVNISGDGQLAVAAFNDGTIRWYRITDGEELLAFFPFLDRQRWVLWNPMGYYDASLGADELVGWHVNNGKDGSADFFPLKQVRSIFHRPDVVSKVLRLKDADQAFKLANQERGLTSQETNIARMLPPVVEIVSIKEERSPKPKATVRFRVRTPSGEPVTKIRVLVDGKNVERDLGLKAAGRGVDLKEVTVETPRRGSEVIIVAGNRFFESAPASTKLR